MSARVFGKIHDVAGKPRNVENSARWQYITTCTWSAEDKWSKAKTTAAVPTAYVTSMTMVQVTLRKTTVPYVDSGDRRPGVVCSRGLRNKASRSTNLAGIYRCESNKQEREEHIKKRGG